MSKIIGYQVVNSVNEHWNDRPSFEVLSQSTAEEEYAAAIAEKPEMGWQLEAIVEGMIEKPTFAFNVPITDSETYSCVALSTGHLTDRERMLLDELARDNTCNIVLGRETG